MLAAGPRGRGAAPSSRSGISTSPSSAGSPTPAAWCCATAARWWPTCPSTPVERRSPVYDRPRRPQPRAAAGASPATSPRAGDRGGAARALLGSPDLASKRWIWEQYDHMVMARHGAAARAATPRVVRIHGTAARASRSPPTARPRYCFADPVTRRPAGGGRGLAQPRRGRRAAARHHRLPELRQPREARRSWGSSSGCIEGMGDACRALDFPVVSGNVSLYNETDGRAILPTPDDRRSSA